MPIKVYIHTTHRQFTNGLEVVAVEGKSCHRVPKWIA